MNATTSRVSVAIVEDHDDLREGFIEFLKDQQFEVSGLSCGEELDEHLALHQPSILILDIGLPGEDGFEISAIRRAHRQRIEVGGRDDVIGNQTIFGNAARPAR